MGVPSDEELEAHYALALEQGADPEFLPYTKGGMTGVVGILRCGEGPTIAMRFDIDALGVVEADEPEHRPAAEGFASVNRGAMHACGHDGHATMGMGVAEVLMAIKDQLHGTVKLIFQPAAAFCKRYLRFATCAEGNFAANEGRETEETV